MKRRSFAALPSKWQIVSEEWHNWRDEPVKKVKTPDRSIDDAIPLKEEDGETTQETIIEVQIDDSSKTQKSGSQNYWAPSPLGGNTGPGYKAKVFQSSTVPFYLWIETIELLIRDQYRHQRLMVPWKRFFRCIKWFFSLCVFRWKIPTSCQLDGSAIQ